MNLDRLFSYKLANDSGFAPNPFFGYLSLATCKPQIRRAKKVGDWIAGFTSKKLNNDDVGSEKLVYLMKVAKKIDYNIYWNEKKYKDKIPNLETNDFIYKCGDNIYQPKNQEAKSPHEFIEIKNKNHWDHKNDNESIDSKIHDVNGRYVLIAEEFYYLGKNAIEIPLEIRPNIPKGQSSNGSLTKDSKIAHSFLEYIKNKYKSGIYGKPHRWPENDDSWKTDENYTE